jgi:hypothetical protein
MKFAVGLIALLFVSPTWAGDEYWRHGITDEAFDITVYRTEYCGCCKGWISHLEDHNFNVTDNVVDDVNPFKEKYRVPSDAASCHTAVVNGLVVEGHVPAQDIKRLLGSDHDIHLLTVPAMPSGTPGMDMPGARKDDFDVISVTRDGKVGVFNTYSEY